MNGPPDRVMPQDCRNRSGVPASFEMAYEIRVAIDQVRFAIKSSEQFGHDPTVMTEVRMQLVDALQRLETAERLFSRGLRKEVPDEDTRRS